VERLEREVKRLSQQLQGNGSEQPWYIRQAGAFKDDPGFEEMMRYAREYRNSVVDPTQPKRRRNKRARS